MNRSWSTGGPRSPSRSTERPVATRWAWRRRRHFAVEGQHLLGIEDELFGEGHLGVGHDEGLDGSPGVGPPTRDSAATRRCWPRSNGVAPARSATSSPPSRANRTRSSVPRRPACSSCRAVPAPARPWSPCIAPRTSSTRTGSRSRTRACWSSGPTVCSCATSSGCCRRSARPASSRSCSPISCPTCSSCDRATTVTTGPTAARLKGDARMSDVIDQAISDRQRPLRDDLVLPFRTGYVRLRADESARIVRTARRRFRRHNSGRRFVESEFWSALAVELAGRRGRPAGGRATRCAAPTRCAPRSTACGRCSPRRSCCTTCSARRRCSSRLGGACSTTTEALLLFRERSETVADVRWTPSDVALLDDARDVLGPKLGKNGKVDESTRSARTATS